MPGCPNAMKAGMTCTIPQDLVVTLTVRVRPVSPPLYHCENWVAPVFQQKWHLCVALGCHVSVTGTVHANYGLHIHPCPPRVAMWLEVLP